MAGASSPGDAAAPPGLLLEAARTLRPEPGARHGPLPPLMLALTIVTGVVDAVSYLKLGHVFVANMTGNVVFLGFAIGGASGLSAGTSLAAIGAFMLGAVAGGRLGVALSGHRGHILRAASSLQAVLLAVALVLAITGASAPAGGERYALVVALALAMGLQNAAAQRLAVPELTTTVLTRTLTGIFSESRLLGGPGAQAGRRALAVAAMLAGAVLGAVLALQVSIAAAVAAALAIVASVAVAVHLLSGPAAPWAREQR